MCDAVQIEQDVPKPEIEIQVEKCLLEPDHPLLVSFQKALKEHLLTLIDRTQGEIYEIEVEARKKNIELEKLGTETYESQQNICRQQEVFGNLIKNVETMTERCNQEEENLDKNKKQLKETEDKLFNTQKVNRELYKELSAIRDLNYNLSQSENDLEGHIKVNRRIASKRRVENETLSKEKRRQDYLMQTLVSEMWKIESDIESVTLELKVKQECIDEMEEKIAVGNSNISALQTEYRCLMHSWNSVIVAIGQRDNGLDCLREKVATLNRKYTNITSEIETTKKQIKKIMLENERLTGFRLAIVTDQEKNLHTYEKEMQKKEELERQILEFQKIIVETEKKMEVLIEDTKQQAMWYDLLQKEFDKISERKMCAEREIGMLLTHQMSNDKLTKKQTLILNEVMEKRTTADVTVQKIINKKSAVCASMEDQKLKNEELNRQVRDQKEHIDSLNVEISSLTAKVESQEFTYRKQKMKYKVLKDKIQSIMDREVEDNLTSKEELRLQELENLIKDIEVAIRNLHQCWLSEQNGMIRVSKDRQDKIHMLNIKRKELLISQQKNLRICDELEEIKKQQEKVGLNIRRLTSKASKLCDEMCNKRERKQQLDNHTLFLKGYLEDKLKDAELELLKIEADITEIEDEKVTLSKDLIEANREGLAWESKFKLAKHVLIESREERNKGGEVNIMRSNLVQRKMIFGQMKKTQHRLLKEMKICIFKRETIFFKSEATIQIENRSKRSLGDRSRVNFARKTDDLKNQIKQCENKIEVTKKEIQTVDQKIQEHEDGINRVTERTSFNFEIQNDFKKKLEDVRTNRQLNFEVLLLRQKRAEMFRLLVKNRTPFRKFKNDEDLISEYAKEKDVNIKLTHLVNILEKIFSLRSHELIRMFNSLSIVLASSA